jgi:uncharacterized membrane protein
MVKSFMKDIINTRGISGLFISIFSATGIYSALTLSVEKLRVTENANTVLSCNINDALNCVSVMNSWQASLLGFPNTYIGLIGYGITFLLGFLLLSGHSFKKIILQLAFLGSFFAFFFSYWLMWQSTYIIGSLCIYCIISCISSTNIFFGILILSLKENIFNFSNNLLQNTNTFIDKGYYWIIFAIWYLFVIGLIFVEYRDTLFL